MGGTVTTGRTAAAFRARSGAVIYCLYEQTYSKNCYPHTPHWSAVYIGTVEGAVQKVFDFASNCEGGMLQNRSGRITPEGYLRSWLAELRSPARMVRDHSLELYAKADSTYAPLQPESVPELAATLAAAGLNGEADRLLAEERATLSLFEHGDLIAQLLEERQIPPWRLLPDYSRPPAAAPRDPSLRIAAAQTKTNVAAPRHPPALVVSTHGDMILREADGAWRCQGWPYEIMASHIRSLATVEQARPGTYGGLIRSYRDHLKTARLANPAALVVQADKHLAADEWGAKRIAEAAALPGATCDGDVVTIPFTAEHEYALCHLPRAATTWLVLDEDRVRSAASGSNSGLPSLL